MPVAAAALTGALSFTLIMVLSGTNHLWMAADVLFPQLQFFGMVATVVIGVGVLHIEVQPGIETFWRSRPIRPSLWFWTKYLTGLALLAFAFGVPVGVIGTCLDSAQPGEASGSVLLVTWATGIAGYSLAIAWMAVTRHTVYASILAFGSTLAFLSWLYSPSTSEAVCLLVIGVIAALTAWLFVAKNWGWRGE